MESDSKQTGLKRDEKGRIIGGTPPAGFNKHPENRCNGRWRAENSITYNYNKLLAMSVEELAIFKPSTVAQKIALSRVRSAVNPAIGLADTKEITDRTEGRAAQSIDMTTKGESINPYSSLTVEELRKLAS